MQSMPGSEQNNLSQAVFRMGPAFSSKTGSRSMLHKHILSWGKKVSGSVGQNILAHAGHCVSWQLHHLKKCLREGWPSQIKYASPSLILFTTRFGMILDYYLLTILVTFNIRELFSGKLHTGFEKTTLPKWKQDYSNCSLVMRVWVKSITMQSKLLALGGGGVVKFFLMIVGDRNAQRTIPTWLR